MITSRTLLSAWTTVIASDSSLHLWWTRSLLGFSCCPRRVPTASLFLLQLPLRILIARLRKILRVMVTGPTSPTMHANINVPPMQCSLSTVIISQFLIEQVMKASADSRSETYYRLDAFLSPTQEWQCITGQFTLITLSFISFLLSALLLSKPAHLPTSTATVQ